jgi:hypothetical protein
VLKPSFYAINPLTRTLRPVRVPSDQNIGWRLSFPLFTNKEQEFIVLSTHTILDHSRSRRIIVATPHTCDKNILTSSIRSNSFDFFYLVNFLLLLFIIRTCYKLHLYFWVGKILYISTNLLWRSHNISYIL